MEKMALGKQGFIAFCFIFLFTSAAFTQDKYKLLEDTLQKVSANIPALEEKVNISVTNVSLQEFLRGVAKNSGLNIDVSPDLNYMVINNFSGVKVKDILVFICRQYDLDLRIIGNIITVYKEQQPEVFAPEKLSIRYDSVRNLFTLDYRNENLGTVAKEITRLTGNNIILAPGLSERTVTGYIQNMPFENALNMFMFANNLKQTHTDDNFYLVEEINQPKQEIQQQRDPKNSRSRRNQQNTREGEEYELNIIPLGPDSFKVVAVNAPIAEIIDELSVKANKNYYISSPMEESATLKVEGSGFDEIINNMLNGTKYSCKKSGNIYVLGEGQTPGLKEHAVVQLQNRTIDKMVEFLPQNLLKDVEIVEFPDLNSLLVSGSPANVRSVEEFVKKLDKIVPVILIEVIIVDISRKFTLTTGVNAGFGNAPIESAGNIFPDVNVTIGADAFNEFLKKNNHFGIKNMGNVAPNFYLTLKALEEQGLLNIRSTPKLSTLNGHEATLTIGNTEYYLEEQSNLIGTQNPVESRSQVYKSLNAELSIVIKPIVSGDDQITLSIEVNQSDFTDRISPTAPPGTVSRNFKSEIRVKNQEMILLGGLEEKRITNTASGTPFLSRIPVIRWFFGSRTKEDTKAKLNVFIRPTIIG